MTFRELLDQAITVGNSFADVASLVATFTKNTVDDVAVANFRQVLKYVQDNKETILDITDKVVDAWERLRNGFASAGPDNAPSPEIEPVLLPLASFAAACPDDTDCDC